MGGGTGTGAAPVVARCAKEAGILTVGVVTKPFHFEGVRRMRVAENGITELHKVVDTLLIIPNQNLFRVANEKTTFADAFAMADQVLYSGVACITDLMVKEGLINLDFADVRAVMREMGKAMMGTGEASGEKRALSAAEAAISNPLIDDASMKGARGLLISITGGKDLTLYEVDEAATRIREEVDQDANIIVGATFDESLDGIIRVSVVATGIDQASMSRPATVPEARIAELTQKLRAEQQRRRHRAPRDPGTWCRTTPTVPPIPPQPDAGSDRKCRQGCRRGRGPADGRGGDHPSDPTQAFAVSGADREPVRIPAGPARFHSAGPRTHAQRARRMPDIDELPRPAQAELRAKRGEQAGGDNPEKRKVGLLRRLAAVGLGRREEEEEPDMLPVNVRPVRPVPRPADRTPQAPRGTHAAASAAYVGAGVGIRQASESARARRPRPASPCEQFRRF